MPSRVQVHHYVFSNSPVISKGASVDRKHLAANSEDVFEPGGQKWHPE
jgi:hypothetical protein